MDCNNSIVFLYVKIIWSEHDKLFSVNHLASLESNETKGIKNLSAYQKYFTKSRYLQR